MLTIAIVFARRRGRQPPNESRAVSSVPGFVGAASVVRNFRSRLVIFFFATERLYRNMPKYTLLGDFGIQCRPAKFGKFACTSFDHPLMAWRVPNEFASTLEDPDFELTQEILLAMQSFCLLLPTPIPPLPISLHPAL